jgi:geranylgeranyl pyrophosphate synthase
LIPLAFEKLSAAYSDEPKIALDLIRLLAHAAGSERLVGGQMEDLLAEGKDPNEETLSFVHENKTAALIEASLMMGFRLGGEGENKQLLDSIQKAGKSLGLAFQAVDDLLDVTSNVENLGKDAGQDSGNNKMTWVAMIGEQKARELAKEHTQKATSTIQQIGGENKFLLELIDAMLNRTN